MTYSYLKKKVKVEPMQAVLLARVSSAEQERGDSIDAQMKTVRDYCIQHNIPILAEYKITESSSHGERLKFYEMIEFIKKQRGKILIVANTIDRIQRRFKEYILLDDLRLNNKIEMYFIREHLTINQKSNSYEIGTWTQGVMWAQQYVLQSSDNIKRANEESRNKGRWLHQAPMGYINYRDETGLALVKIDPIKGPLVKRVLEEYSTGNYTLSRLVIFANNIGLTTRKGNPLNLKTLDNMIRNPFYYGIMRTVDVLRPHTCGNLITKELFDKNQEILSGKSRQFLTKQSDTFLFNGLCFCATCGCMISQERHTKKNGKSYTYLRCCHHKGNCNQPIVNEEVILDQIKTEVFDKFKVSDKMLELLKSEVKKNIEKEYAETILMKTQIQKKLEEVAYQKSRCVDLLINNTIDKTVYDMKMSELNDREVSMNYKLASFDTVNGEINQIVNGVVDFANNMGKYFESSDFSLKKEILQILIPNSLLDSKKLVLSITKPFDAMLKSKNCEVWCAQEESNP